ncbi:MAG: WD40 repeat domain-containing protein [Chloroflexi bacterium]|nr:WD40 repeat domain-containing protein [Chloroflexota bacterium]
MFDALKEQTTTLLRARIDWSPDGKLLAAGIGPDVHVWETGTWNETAWYVAGGSEALVYFESGHHVPEGIVSLAWNDDSSLLLARSVSSRTTVWAGLTQALTFDQTAGNNPVAVHWLVGESNFTDGEGYISSSDSGSRTHPVPDLLAAGCLGGTGIDFSASQGSLAVATLNGCIIVVDATTGMQERHFRLLPQGLPVADVALRDLAWSPDGSEIAAISETGSLYIVSANSGDYYVINLPKSAVLSAVDWSSDGTLAYVGLDADGTSLLATVGNDELSELIGSAATLSSATVVVRGN